MVDKLNTYTLNRPRLKKALGWLFVLVGFVALIAPIIPGAPLVFIGFELLGLRFIFTDKIRNIFRKGEPVSLPVANTILAERL